MATKVVLHENGPSQTDVKEIRRRARLQIMEGAVTSDYGGDQEMIVRILNQVLTTRTCGCPPFQAPLLHGERYPLSGGCGGVS